MVSIFHLRGVMQIILTPLPKETEYLCKTSCRCKVGDKGVVQAEPRLDAKKYRRQSRKRVNQSLLDELDELDDEDDKLEVDNPILRALREENQ